MARVVTAKGRGRRRVGAVLLGVLAVVVVLVVVARKPWDTRFRLPARIAVTLPLQDIGVPLEPTAVEVQASDAPVRLGRFNPHRERSAGAVGERDALVVQPPTRLRFRTRVPADALLRFGVGVAPQPASKGAAIRFSVKVDGQPAYDRVVNPVANRDDANWLDAQIEFGNTEDRDLDLVFETALSGEGAAVGTPAWSKVRLAQRSWHDRQLVSPERPNVLVLLIDTLRADRLGCYGATPSPSPALDRLAAEGLVFDQAIAQSSWTMPSVATLLTGRHPTSHGVGRPGPVLPEAYLPNAMPTVARHASLAGITTIGESSNPLISRGTNFSRGFETFFEFAWRAGQREGASVARVNEKFLRWLDRNARYRFFAYLHYIEPHEPYVPVGEVGSQPPSVRPAIVPGSLREVARDISLGKAPQLSDAEVEYLHALYDGEIRRWDEGFGRLLADLRTRGLLDKTIVIVTSDHGEEFQEHGGLLHGTTLYDELLRVPLIVAGPGVPRGHKAVQAEGVDLFPTVAALLGFDPPPDLPGRNLLAPGVESRPALVELGGSIESHTTATRPLAALRTPTWKLVHDVTADTYELYDLAADPGERTNRFASAPESAELVASLARTRAKSASPSAAEATAPDPRVEERLRALGYLH